MTLVTWQTVPAAIALALLTALVAWQGGGKWLRRIVAGFAVLLIAISSALFYFLPIFELPAPNGPHAIGTRQFELTDTSRTGVLEDSADTPRRILVRAWYPATNTTDLPTRPYLTADEVRDRAIAVFEDFGLPEPQLMYRHFQHVRTHSHVDAPLAGANPLPVIVFSHGYWCWLGQNTALMEQLASHGYLVFSIGHPHDAGTMTFADGVK